MTNAQLDVSAVAAVRQALEAAENSGDTAALAELLTDDAVLMVPDFPAQEGKAACARFVQEIMSSLLIEFARRVTYVSTEIVVVGDIAFDRGTFSIDVSARAGGERTHVTGKYLWLLRRIGPGPWKIARLIVSRDDTEMGHQMMNFKHRALIACVGVICVAGLASAQSNPRYVRFAGVPASVKGALYMPDAPLPAPHVGIVVMHRTSNFMTALACTELSRRGFAVLCMNPRSDNNEALVRFETIPLDVRAGVQFLKSQPGITRIVLWGWSGGGATMTLYQSVAETGVSVCQGPGKLVQCGNELAGLPPADGLILVDAHPGNPVNALRSLNGAVTNEAASRSTRSGAQSLQPGEWVQAEWALDLLRRIQDAILQGAGRSDEQVDQPGARPPGANEEGGLPVPGR